MTERTAMDAEMMKLELTSSKLRESRYQWVIMFLIAIVGFCGGYAMQNERMRDQVVTNTAEIRVIKENLMGIQSKLDQLLVARK